MSIGRGSNALRQTPHDSKKRTPDSGADRLSEKTGGRRMDAVPIGIAAMSL